MYYCDMCFVRPAVCRAYGTFLCQNCLEAYAEQTKPKIFCGRCEEPKWTGHSCSAKFVPSEEVYAKIKFMGD